MGRGRTPLPGPRPECPRCGAGSGQVQRSGRAGDGRQRYRCAGCARYFVEPRAEETEAGPARPRYRCPDCGRQFRDPPPPVPPIQAWCPACFGRRLQRFGRVGAGRDRQRYRCKGCGRVFNEPLPPPAAAACPPCPDCGGRCVRAGKTAYGLQLYRCRGCGRQNTEGFRRRWAGVYPYRVSLCLNYRATRAVMRYCDATRLSAAEAVRRIFGAAAEETRPAGAATGRPLRAVWDWEGRARLVEAAQTEAEGQRARAFVPPPDVDVPFPNVVAQVQRRRWLNPLAQFRPSVLVEVRLTVPLDARAKAGLQRACRALGGVTHQEAARRLLADALPPGKSRVASGQG